jgi:16S rRNA (adenine1518-N6/adenine1519-N6)-dimethyltransferase
MLELRSIIQKIKMIDLADKEQLIKYLQAHGLYTKHRLGQNFLIDRQALNQIVEAAEINSSDFVVEVGPGLGVMTSELVKQADKVVAIEIDATLARLLRENVGDGKLDILNSDILAINVEELTKSYEKYKVVANIPYYITSKIIKQFLTSTKKPETIVLLVQKEVAERICAKKGDMSILALSVQAYSDPNVVKVIKADSFFPAPDVDSAILKIENIRYKLPEIDEEALFRTIKIGFSSRRKTLLNNFAAGLRLDKEATSDIIKSAAIDPSARAEDLNLDDWARLTNKVIARM